MLIKSQLREISRLRAFVRVFLNRNPVTEISVTTCAQLVLVAHEITTNIIRHACGGDPEISIWVVLDAFPHCIRLTFIHRGEPFHPSRCLPEPAFDGSVDHGFGLYIIDQIIDRSDYGKTPSGENYILLEKKTAPKSLELDAMELKIDKIDDIVVITLPGESIDTSNAKELRAQLDSILEENQKVVFDMSQLKFLDSSGLGTMLSCLRRINSSGGELKLCNMTQQVKVLFELVRMHKIFEISSSIEEAVTSFSKATD